MRALLCVLFIAFAMSDPVYAQGNDVPSLIKLIENQPNDMDRSTWKEKRRDAARDCPVVFWDHEWVGTEKEIQPMFSSSAKMFECLRVVATSDVDFVYHDESDDPALLPKKRALLAEFLSIDPEGAGGPAREYWTCWGVTPAA